MDYNEIVNKLIQNGTKNITNETITLNNDNPILLKDNYKIKEGQPIYFELDEYGRSNGAIAILSKNTLPLVLKKHLNYPNPYGWTQNIENQHIFERCHIIAYNLSAKIADKRNIFIGTEHLNASTMMIIENKIRKYIENNDVKILYKVTIKYKEDNLIPIGLLIEAQSLNDEFSICKFCYNIQKGIMFQYTDGTIIKNTLSNKIKQIVTKKNNVKNNKKDVNNINKNYLINRQNNEFHLYNSHCNKLNDIESKYIIETTAKKSDLLKINLIPCDKCIKNN